MQNLMNATNASYGRLKILQGGNMKNGGWPKFDGTYKNYPSFKRKWTIYENTHPYQQNEKEKVQQFM